MFTGMIGFANLIIKDNHTRSKHVSYDRKVMENLGDLLRDSRNSWNDIRGAIQENCPMCNRTYSRNEDKVTHAASQHYLIIGQYFNLK